AIPGNDVEGAGARAADRVVVGLAVDDDAVHGVGHGHASGFVGTDVVAEHEVAGRGLVLDLDAAERIPGNHIAGAGGRTADGVDAGPGVNDDAVPDVGQRHRARLIGADIVAFDKVAGGVCVLELNAAELIAGNDIEGARGCTPDGVVAGLGVDEDSFHGV